MRALVTMNQISAAHNRAFNVAAAMPLPVVRSVNQCLNAALIAGDDLSQFLARLQQAPALKSFLAERASVALLT